MSKQVRKTKLEVQLREVKLKELNKLIEHTGVVVDVVRTDSVIPPARAGYDIVAVTKHVSVPLRSKMTINEADLFIQGGIEMFRMEKMALAAAA